MNNKLAFLSILLFVFSSFCMDETQPTLSQQETNDAITDARNEDYGEDPSAQVEGSSNDFANTTTFLVTESSSFQHGPSPEEMSSDEAEDEDLPSLSLFLRDGELVNVEIIINKLKKAKKTRRNLRKPGLLLHGPADNGKLTIGRIISDKSGWNLVVIESQKLVEGEYFNEEEVLNNEQRHQRFELILKNLDKEGEPKSDKKIKNVIKALLCTMSKEPTILFLHNIEVLFDAENSTTLNMLMESFRDFKLLGLMFLIGSTHHSNMVTNRLTTKLLRPIHVQLPDWKKRNDILRYYFKKYDIRIQTSGLTTELFEYKAKKRVLIYEFFIILIGITKNFSGGDLEELVLSVNHVIDAKATHAHEVWSIDMLKDSYCWDDFESGFFSSIRLGLSPFELVFLQIKRYDDNGPHEYLFSIVKMLKEENQWEATMTLSEKISKKRRCWNVIKLIGSSGEEIVYGISAFVLNKGADYSSKVLSDTLSGIINCGSGTVGLTTYVIKSLVDGAQAVSSEACKLGTHLVKPAVDAVLENTREEIKRLALEESKKLYSSKEKEDKDKEKVKEGEKEYSVS